MLNFSSLRKALGSLNRAVERAEAHAFDEELRDAAIQRFEYSFELCWKMLKRKLEEDSATPADVDRMSFKDLIREGFERGFIEDPSDWFVFREHRNTVAHTYDAEKAKAVFHSAVKLNSVGRLLLEALEAQNHGD